MGDLPKRKIAPFPIEIVAVHPAVMAMTCGPYGMLMRILQHWWLSELRELSPSESELMAIARAHKPTWFQHKREIMRVLLEVKPDFEHRYNAWKRSRGSILARASNGGVVAAQRRKRVKVEAAPDLAPLSVVASQASTERRQAAGKQRASGTFRE